MIFGSTAIKHWHAEFRTPNDLDVMSQEVCMSKEKQHYWIPEFELLINQSFNPDFLSPDMMLTLKASHANWDIHWAKTMSDILFLQNKCWNIDEEIYYELVKGWRKVHGRESAPLKGKTADQFFNDAVKRVYVHDDIHKAVAYNDEPIYLKTQPDKNKVTCSEALFNKLSFLQKIQMAKEEIFVTALERYIIPNNFNYSHGRAYNASLKKFVTTMSSNWMSLFLIKNFEFLRYDPTDDYVGKFQKNIKQVRLIS